MIAAIGLASIAAMLVVLLKERIPLWNPTYFFGAALGAQIGLGYWFAHTLGIIVEPAFSALFVGANVLAVGVFFSLTQFNKSRVKSVRYWDATLRQIRLSPRTAQYLRWTLAAIAMHNMAVNAVIIARWKTLPVIAYTTLRHLTVGGITGTTLPQDVAAAFTVPFFSVVADHLTNPAVVVFFVLLACETRPATKERQLASQQRRLRRLRSSAVVYGSGALLLFNAAIVPRRNALAVAIYTLALLALLSRKLSRRTFMVVGVGVLAVVVAIGAVRRGVDRGFGAAMQLGLADTPGASFVYEPAVYLGGGVLNFHRYVATDPEPSHGAMLASSIFPRPIDEALGLNVNRTAILRDLYKKGFVLQGQTLRTGWFEPFFEFGWAGVYLTALLFPVTVFFLYLRALHADGRGLFFTAYFSLFKIILFFPLINIIFQLPFWVAFAVAVFTDLLLRRSRASRRGVHVRGSTEVESGVPG